MSEISIYHYICVSSLSIHLFTDTLLRDNILNFFYLDVVDKTALWAKTAIRKVYFHQVVYFTNLMIFNEIRLHLHVLTSE